MAESCELATRQPGWILHQKELGLSRVPVPCCVALSNLLEFSGPASQACWQTHIEKKTMPVLGAQEPQGTGHHLLPQMCKLRLTACTQPLGQRPRLDLSF
jgi:hypothetical protein